MFGHVTTIQPFNWGGMYSIQIEVETKPSDHDNLYDHDFGNVCLGEIPLQIGIMNGSGTDCSYWGD